MSSLEAENIGSSSSASSAPTSSNSPSPISLKTSADRKIRPLKSLNFYDCIPFLYMISRFSGSLPFSLRYDSNGHLEKAFVSGFDAVVFITTIITYCTTIVMLQISMVVFATDDIQSAVLFTATRLVLTFGLFSATFSVIFDFFNRNRFVKILQDLHAFDKKVIERI